MTKKKIEKLVFYIFQVTYEAVKMSETRPASGTFDVKVSVLLDKA